MDVKIFLDDLSDDISDEDLRLEITSDDENKSNLFLTLHSAGEELCGKFLIEDLKQALRKLTAD